MKNFGIHYITIRNYIEIGLVPGAINPLHPCTVDAWYLRQCLAVVSKDCTI